MKNVIWISLVAVGLVTATSSSASAAHITADTFLGAALLANSGIETEETALEAAAAATCGGCNLELVSKTDIDDEDLGTHDGLNYINVFPNTPGYFVLKFGGGDNENNPNAITADTFFFKNIAELNLLVWADGTIDGAGGKAGAISHYAITENVTDSGEQTDSGQESSGPGEGPEPALLSLLGVGLLGAAARIRKRS